MKKLFFFIVLLFIVSIFIGCGVAKETEHTKASKPHTEKVEIKSDTAIKQKADDENKIQTKNQHTEEQSTDVSTKSHKDPVPDPKPEKVLVDAPIISQLPELPNGCEVTSLTMLLQQAGVSVDKMTLAKQMKTVPFNENGVHGDPNDGFVGNMYHGAPGFAVYHGPVAALARQYLNTKIVDMTGSDWSDIEKKLAANHAVWVIINSSFKKLAPQSFQTWHTKNGDMQVTMHEHSVLLTGYDATNVYFNDPLTNTKNKSVEKEDFKEAWVQMGSQAISYNN